MEKVSLKKENGIESSRKRSKIRIVLGLILVALVIAFSLTVLINMRQRIDAASDAAEQNLLWRGLQDDYIVCAALLIVALGIAFGIAPARRHIVLRILGGIVWCAALVVTAEAVYLCTKTVIHSSDRDDTSGVRYAVLVGDALQNRQPSDELNARIDTAADWWKAAGDDDIIIIASNASVQAIETDSEEEVTTQEAAVTVEHAGRVKSKGSTPSAVIKKALDEKGVPKYAVKEEKVSESVRDCFEQVLKQFNKVKANTPIVIITNGCYMNDTVRIAKDVGFTNVSRLPAASSFKGFLTDILWETWLENDPVLTEAMQ